MRSLLIAMATAVAVGGCAIVGQIATKQDADKTKECMAQVKATPEWQLVHKRLWNFDSTDTAEKLSDPKPLTPPERDALIQLHNRMEPCKQIIIAHDNQYAAWETPYWQAAFQRSDQIFYKLASGELPVGLANKLSIESNGQFQVDVSKGHAEAVRIDEVRQQQAAQAMLQASAQMQAAQPRMSTTNCSWLGNNLNCTTIH